MINKIELEVKDKIVKEFGSFDSRVHRAIKLTQQKTAQSIFDDLKGSIVCNDKLCNAPACISFQNLKKKHGVK